MKQKIIFITGTSSGFGWLTAKSCTGAGHKMYATMRNTTTINAEKAKNLSHDAAIKVLDVELISLQSVTDAVALVLEKEERIDVLINNAGVYATGLAETFTNRIWRKYWM